MSVTITMDVKNQLISNIFCLQSYSGHFDFDGGGIPKCHLILTLNWKTERTLLTHLSIGILKILMLHFSSMIATMVLMRLKSPRCWASPPSLLLIGFSPFLMRLRGERIHTYSQYQRGMACH